MIDKKNHTQEQITLTKKGKIRAGENKLEQIIGIINLNFYLTQYDFYYFIIFFLLSFAHITLTQIFI